MVATQSHLLQKETYLVDRIENNSRDKMRHLKCVCFLRPTADSLEKLIQELRDPCYGDYYLCKSECSHIHFSLVFLPLDLKEREGTNHSLDLLT